MPKRISRVQITSVPGKPLTSIEILINALNGEEGRQKTKASGDNTRLLGLFVHRFRNFDRALRVANSRSDSKDPYYDPDVSKGALAINRLLGRYRLIPTLLPQVGGRDDGSLGWRIRWWREGYEQPFTEFGSVQTIERLASEGLIDSLKQCGQCKRWLFARFSHQRFCSDSCKETFHRTNPEDKKRRREWARANYKLQTTKNVK